MKLAVNSVNTLYGFKKSNYKEKTFMNAYRLLIILFAVFCTNSAYSSRDILVLNEAFYGSSKSFLNALEKQLGVEGFQFTLISAEDLNYALDFRDATGSILILPDGRYFPAESKTALINFLKRGNHLVAFSGPAFENMVIKTAKGWLSRKELLKEIEPSDSILLVNFENISPDRLQRYHGPANNDANYTVEAFNSEKVLHAKISKLDDYDYISGLTIATKIPKSHSVLAFNTKNYLLVSEYCFSKEVISFLVSSSGVAMGRFSGGS